MPNKKRKQPVQATLSAVWAAMSKPRMAESSKENADTLANGGHIATRAANQADLQTAMSGDWEGICSRYPSLKELHKCYTVKVAHPIAGSLMK
jgi:hypothetical protein